MKKYEEGHEDSPPKRRRTVDSGSEMRVLAGSEVKVLSLDNHEALSKGSEIMMMGKVAIARGTVVIKLGRVMGRARKRLQMTPVMIRKKRGRSWPGRK